MFLAKHFEVKKNHRGVFDKNSLPLAGTKDKLHLLTVRQGTAQCRTRCTGRKLYPFRLGLAAILGICRDDSE